MLPAWGLNSDSLVFKVIVPAYLAGILILVMGGSWGTGVRNNVAVFCRFNGLKY